MTSAQKEQHRFWIPNQSFWEAAKENKLPSTTLLKNGYKLIKTRCSYSFLEGTPDYTQLTEIHNMLISLGEVDLVCDQSLHPWFLQKGYNPIPRVQLVYKAKEIQVSPLPKGYSFKEIDQHIFPKCMWHDLISLFYGDDETFLQHGWGAVLCDANNNIVSEVYGIFSNQFCEILVITHPDHQGRGWAGCSVRYMVAKCLHHKLTPFWTCNLENIASLKVAIKAGFDIDQYYAFYSHGIR